MYFSIARCITFLATMLFGISVSGPVCQSPRTFIMQVAGEAAPPMLPAAGLGVGQDEDPPGAKSKPRPLELLPQDVNVWRKQQGTFTHLPFDTSRLGSFQFQNSLGSWCVFSLQDRCLRMGGSRPSSGWNETCLDLATGLLDERADMAGFGSGQRSVQPFHDGRYPGRLGSLARNVAAWTETNQVLFGYPDHPLRAEERKRRDALVALLKAVASQYPKATFIPARDLTSNVQEGDMRSVSLSVSAPGTTSAQLLYSLKPPTHTWERMPDGFKPLLEYAFEDEAKDRLLREVTRQPMARSASGRFRAVIGIPQSATALWYIFVVEDRTGRSSIVSSKGNVFRWLK